MDSSEKTPVEAQPLRRREYECPRIEESGAFERLVLACVHQTGVSPACNMTPNS